MRSVGILSTALLFWATKGWALRCMNCSSSSITPLAGCHGELLLEHMIDCPSNATYCQVSRYKGAYEGIGIIQYDRFCAKDFREECFAMSDIVYDGVTCIFSCQEDGCNSMNIFPNEPEYSTPTPPAITTLSARLIPETPRTLICYNCTSGPDDPPGICGAKTSHEALIACHAQEKYCLVSKVLGSDIYSRTCSYIGLDECEDYDYEGTVCHRTCTTDGCNDFSEFGEDSEKVTSTNQASTTAATPSIRGDATTPSSGDTIHANRLVFVLAFVLILTFKEPQVR